MKLSLAIQTPEVPTQLPVALLTGSLEDKLRKAAALGAEGVELIVFNPGALDAEGIRRGLKRNALEAAAVASGALGFAKITLLHPDPQTRETARTRLADLIHFASRIEAQVVTLGGFRGRSVGTHQVSLDELAELLGGAAETAQRLGVRLALEPLNRYETDLIQNAAQGLDFLRRVSHPAIGLLLDTYHVNIEEASWTEPFRRVLSAGKLFHVHLGDNNRLPPGKGLIDFQAILETLQTAGYGGYLSAELLALPDPDTAAADTLSTMRKLMRRVRESAAYVSPPRT